MKILLKNCVLACLVLFGGALFAKDSDGHFVGVGLGFSQGQLVTDYGYMKIKEDAEVGFDGGIMLGGKWFVNDYFGARVYLRGNYATLSYATLPFDVHNFDLNVNVDLLVNFINNDNFSLGVFGGVGLGGMIYTWDSNYPLDSNNKTTFAGFDTQVNLGLRSVIANHHEINFHARVPIFITKISTDINGVDWGLYKKYAINFSYIYNF